MATLRLIRVFDPCPCCGCDPCDCDWGYYSVNGYGGSIPTSRKAMSIKPESA